MPRQVNPTPVQADTKPGFRRRQHYIDSAIQRPLLLALVLLEITLLLAASWLAYEHLNTLIDAHLYRVHISEARPVWVQLAQEGGWMLLLFATVNLLALLVVEWAWIRRENLVLMDFRRLCQKSETLDFSADAPPARPYRVLLLASSWRTREGDRFKEIRAQAQRLCDLAASPAGEQELRDAILRLKNQLT